METKQDQEKFLINLMLQVERLIPGDFKIYQGYSGRSMFGVQSNFAFTCQYSPYSSIGNTLRSYGLTFDSMCKEFIYYTLQ